MSRPSLDPKLAFLAGWLLGRRRRKAGISLLFLLGGLLGCLMGGMLIVFGTPVSWGRSRQVAALPRPEPAALPSLAPGTTILLSARLPEEAPTGPYGLALFYTERRVADPSPTGESGGKGASRSSQWRREPAEALPIPVRLEDGTEVTVQVLPNATFLNAHRFEEGAEGGEASQEARRYVGYLPGQSLTLEGTWEGEGRFTARTLYPGSPQDYVSYLSRLPIQTFIGGFICWGMSVVFLAVGLFLWLLGK
ncbi:MAG: hypothetical protein D6759_06435 [Chloroflexi bacterium]|nr:MAG: hypothetical protein D6759_06435 [Chloroflexota bacterium]